jgi:hypothetical protein
MIGAIIARNSVKASLEALNRRDVSSFMYAGANIGVRAGNFRNGWRNYT